MHPVSPVIPGHELPEVEIAKGQDEYMTLPAVYHSNGEAHVSRWELSDEELKTLMETRSIYLHIWTFGGATQHVLLTVEKPEVREDG
jgi:hypothetical protein